MGPCPSVVSVLKHFHDLSKEVVDRRYVGDTQMYEALGEISVRRGTLVQSPMWMTQQDLMGLQTVCLTVGQKMTLRHVLQSAVVQGCPRFPRNLKDDNFFRFFIHIC